MLAHPTTSKIYVRVQTVNVLTLPTLKFDYTAIAHICKWRMSLLIRWATSEAACTQAGTRFSPIPNEQEP